MPLITDKFGRASIPTDVAIATTVKTARLAGVLVLEANDLSKYSTDTPVFVVTYKKTTDPLTGAVSITQLRSWKALVNTGANTLTNLTIQPGYVDDIGNAVGDFIECIPTSAWENSLIDGIRTSLNDDGTLKTSAVQLALGIVNTPSVGWNIMAQALTYVSNVGNGEFNATFNGDVTSVLAKGMKLLVPRSVAPPTMEMAFSAASSQYAAKATPTGITFTTAFTIEAEVYLNSYPNGGNSGVVLARYDATNGWGFQLHANGGLQVFWSSGGAVSSYGSYASIPLKQHNHIAVTVTVATKTVVMYINGVSVPFQSYASASTVLTQTAGDIRIGAAPTPAGTYLDGYLGEVRLWSVVRTQTQIRDNMDVALTGSEANLVGLWQGNGNFNDKTANANNMTGAGGAVATQLMSGLDSAYANATEYFYVAKVGAFAAGVTPVTLLGGTDGHLPNAALGTIQYSNAGTPFGFPSAKRKWRIRLLNRSQYILASPSVGVWYNVGQFQLQVPTGEWKLGYNICSGMDRSVAGRTDEIVALSPSNSTVQDPYLEFISGQGGGNAQVFQASTLNKELPVSLSAPTIFYMLEQANVSVSAGNLFLFGTVGNPAHEGIIYADLAYTG